MITVSGCSFLVTSNQQLETRNCGSHPCNPLKGLLWGVQSVDKTSASVVKNRSFRRECAHLLSNALHHHLPHLFAFEVGDRRDCKGLAEADGDLHAAGQQLQGVIEVAASADADGHEGDVRPLRDEADPGAGLFSLP